MIFDRDLKVRTCKEFPITKDGSKINIKSGGKGHFNPLFDNDSYLDIPKKSRIPFSKTTYEKVYFVRNGAKSCIRFRPTPNNLSQELTTLDDLKEMITAADNGQTEAQDMLDQCLQIIQQSSQQDYLYPDPDLVTELAKNEIIKGIGSEEKRETSNIIWLIFGCCVVILLKVMGVVP